MENLLSEFNRWREEKIKQNIICQTCKDYSGEVCLSHFSPDKGEETDSTWICWEWKSA